MLIERRGGLKTVLVACTMAVMGAGCSDQASSGTQATGGAGSSSAGAEVGGNSVAGSTGGGGGAAGTTGGAAGATGGASGSGGVPSGAGGSGGGGAGQAATAGQSSGGAGGAMAGSGGAAGSMGLSGGGGGGSGGAGGDATKVQLFDGTDMSNWKSRNGGGPAPWQVSPGAYFEVVPNSGDIETKQSFGDVQLHVEFWIPSTPMSNSEQDRGNSGIYLQGRYEVQVLDSYMHPLQDKNDCGAIYEVKDADVNASMPPENWQTYEITFHAPKWSGSSKTGSARISVIWNGQQAQKDVEVPGPTKLGDAEAPGDAPLRLQDHGHHVRYRNIWLKPL